MDTISTRNRSIEASAHGYNKEIVDQLKVITDILVGLNTRLATMEKTMNTRLTTMEKTMTDGFASIRSGGGYGGYGGYDRGYGGKRKRRWRRKR